MRAGQAAIVAVSAILLIQSVAPAASAWDYRSDGPGSICIPIFAEIGVNETMREGQRLTLSIPGLESGDSLFIRTRYALEDSVTWVERPDGTTLELLQVEEVIEVTVPGTHVIHVLVGDDGDQWVNVDMIVWYGTPTIALTTPMDGSTVNGTGHLQGYCNFYPSDFIDLSDNGVPRTSMAGVPDRWSPYLQGYESPECIIDGRSISLAFQFPLWRWAARTTFFEGANEIEVGAEVDFMGSLDSIRFVVEDTFHFNYDPEQEVGCRVNIPPTDAGCFSLAGSTGVIPPKGSLQLMMEVHEEQVIRIEWKPRHGRCASFFVNMDIELDGKTLQQEGCAVWQSTESIIVQGEGQSSVTWTNLDGSSEAIVDFAIDTGMPDMSIESPSDGRSDESSPLVTGRLNFLAKSVEVSTDNETFVTAIVSQDVNVTRYDSFCLTSGDSMFTAPVDLRPGTNTINVKATSSSMEGTYETSFRCELDALWSYRDDGVERLGIGAFSLTILLTCAAVTATTLSWRRRR